jgi:hypothetical protein
LAPILVQRDVVVRAHQLAFQNLWFWDGFWSGHGAGWRGDTRAAMDLSKKWQW